MSFYNALSFVTNSAETNEGFTIGKYNIGASKILNPKIKLGSIGIALTRNFTHFLKIVLVVAGGGFYFYHNL